MSDSNRVSLAYIAESVFATTPAAAAIQLMRFTKESLKQDTTVVNSNEIRSDRQIPDVIRTDIGASGDVEWELSYGSHDPLIAAALQSSGWSSVVTVGPISSTGMTASSKTIAGTAIGTGILAGQWVRVSGFANAVNNGIFKVVSSATGSIVLKGNSSAFVDESGASVTVVMGAQIVNGVTQTSYAWEKKYTDLSNIFAIYNGITVTGMNLTVTNQQIITGKFSMLGKKESSATATIGSSYTAVSNTDVMETVDNVLAVLEGYASFGITAFTMDTTNNLRKRSQVGSLGPISIGAGAFVCSGTVNMYFATNAIMDKYLNFTDTSMSMVLSDAAGNAYVIDMPKVNFTVGARETGGQNQDIMANLSYTAMRDPTDGVTLRIARFAAP